MRAVDESCQGTAYGIRCWLPTVHVVARKGEPPVSVCGKHLGQAVRGFGGKAVLVAPVEVFRRTGLTALA